MPKSTLTEGSVVTDLSDLADQAGLATYLKNGGFQLRYVVFVVSLVALITGALGYLIHQQRLETSSTVVGQLGGANGVLDKEGLDYVLSDIDEGDRSTVWPMVQAGLILIGVLTFFLLAMTHLVAGSLNKVSGFFDKMRDGYLGSVWPLRKNLMLRRFYDSFHEMHDAVRARHRECNDAIGAFLDAAEAAGLGDDEGELGHRLAEHRARCVQRHASLL